MSWLTRALGIDKLVHTNKQAAAIIQPISDALKETQKPVLALLTSTFHTNVAGAALNALHGALVTAETDVAKVQASVLHAVTGAVGTVDPALVPVITDAVNGAITAAEHWAEGAEETTVTALLAALSAKLGL